MEGRVALRQKRWVGARALQTAPHPWPTLPGSLPQEEHTEAPLGRRGEETEDRVLEALWENVRGQTQDPSTALRVPCPLLGTRWSNL